MTINSLKNSNYCATVVALDVFRPLEGCDRVVKREIYEREIKGKYNVKFVLDDRNRVVDMWRNDLGLTCLQVAEGNF